MKTSTTRLAYNFLLSYYEVFKKLPDNESKVAFITAICEMQFNGNKIDLEGMADFAYTSQEYQIMQSREGWENVQKRENVVTPSTPPSVGGTVGGTVAPMVAPSIQEKEKEKGKEQGKEETIIPVDDSTLHALQIYVRDNYPNVSSLKTQLTKEQCERLLGQYTKDAIKTKLDAMENKPNLKKNYLAVYNTLNNWLSMERQRNPNFGKLPLTPEQELEILKKERGYHVE